MNTLNQNTDHSEISVKNALFSIMSIVAMIFSMMMLFSLIFKTAFA